MKRILKITIILFILIIPSFSQIIKADINDQNEIQNSTPVIDLFRVLEIDFDPQDLIQDCGSKFILNVT